MMQYYQLHLFNDLAFMLAFSIACQKKIRSTVYILIAQLLICII